MRASLLDDRRVLEVAGADARSFLHNVVTCSVEGLAAGAARYGALLTPQGKIVTDFLLLGTEDGLLLDVPAVTLDELLKRLTLYRLRAKVTLAARDDLAVAVLWGDGAPPDLPQRFADPRLPALGWRAFVPRAEASRALAGAEPGAPAAWHAHRIALGIPEGGRDFVFADAFPHEADMDQLGGVDFRKGCYVGQEVVSRMQHRGTARSRVVPVAIAGPAPEAGAEVTAGERPAGRMGSSAGDRGLALLRLDRAAGERLRAGASELTPLQPGWARFRIEGATPQEAS